MEVPVELAGCARAQVAGLVAHAAFNELCQQPHHFAAQAILEAREQLPPERFSRFMKVNSVAGKARHARAAAPPPAKRVRWADMGNCPLQRQRPEPCPHRRRARPRLGPEAVCGDSDPQPAAVARL